MSWATWSKPRMRACSIPFHATGSLGPSVDGRVDEKPDDVQALIALTEHHQYPQVDLVKAADAAERALALAIEQALLVRQVLGVRMRIALERGNFDVASESLVRLVEYVSPTHSLDVAYERDFLEMIPPGAIESALIERYSALVPVAQRLGAVVALSQRMSACAW